jgi:hypothetical protein
VVLLLFLEQLPEVQRMCDDVIPVCILLRWFLSWLGREDAALCLAQDSMLGSIDDLQSTSSLLLRLLLVYPLCILTL